MIPAERPASSSFRQRPGRAGGRLDDVPNGFARGYGPHQQPLEIVVLDRVASGASTPAAVAAATGADPASVEAALTWAVGQGFLTRMTLRDGDYLTLTESGLASVAWQRRLLTVIGEDGEIDLARLSRDYGAAHQAMQAGPGSTPPWSGARPTCWPTTPSARPPRPGSASTSPRARSTRPSSSGAPPWPSPPAPGATCTLPWSRWSPTR